MQNIIELMRIFCAAAESQSFKAAATKLGRSPQSVTRAIRELEELRGEILFNRTTRDRRITNQGEQLAIRARRLVEELDQLVGEGREVEKASLTGSIKLTAPAAFGRMFLVPLLDEFMRLNPDISIQCTLSDQRADVINEQIDIGLRTGTITDNRFIARKLMALPLHLVAAPSLLKKVAVPESLDDLPSLPHVALYDESKNRLWPWYFRTREYIPSSPRFVTDDLYAYCQALIDGVGFGQIPSYLAEAPVRENRLIRVIECEASFEWGLYIYRPQRGPVAHRIRVLYDFLVDKFSSGEQSVSDAQPIE